MSTADLDVGVAEPSVSDGQDREDDEQQQQLLLQEEQHCLQLQLHTDEAVWMRQIGHLKDWCTQTRSVKLGVPARVATPLAASSLRLLWLFRNLQHLDVTFNSIRSRIEQPVLAACAELLHLTSLTLSGGHLARRGVDLGVLTSLRRLRCLSVRPHSDDELDGLEDEHLAGVARLTGLSSLSLRASENVTDEGVTALTALTGLTQLSLVPMGLWVSLDGVSALSAAMPHLRALAVGLHESRQVAALKGMQERPRQPAATAAVAAGGGRRGDEAAAGDALGPSVFPTISLVLNSPEVSTSGFFSTLTLVLRPRLVSLRMATVESVDGSFMLAVGTLAHLTELKMGVSVPEGGRPFTCHLAALSSLAQLRTLEFAVTRELGLPLSDKMVGLLARSWPRLRSLSLSAMAKPEVAPAALTALAAFSGLTNLSLFAALDYDVGDEDAPTSLMLPIKPRHLPRGLTNLVLECEHLTEGGGQQQPQQQQQQPVDAPRRLHVNGDGPATPHAAFYHASSANGPLSSRLLSAPPPSSTGAHCDGAEVAAGATHESASALLPRLEQLELNNCRVSEEVLGALLRGATGMRHLELTDVRGLTDTALAALATTTRLEHLVLRTGPSGGAGGASGGSSGGTGLSHRSLAALRNASMLRHLEWALPQPLGAAEAEAALGGGGLGGLQQLYLEVEPEMRAAGAARGAGAERDGGSSAGTWRGRLQRALPLCTVSERPGIVMYDLWNDRTVQMVGP